MATLVQSSSGSLVAKTSLAVAVAAADSANKTIVVTGAESIATSLSAPATRNIVNEKGGTITVASGQTLTVLGSLTNNGTITGTGNLVISGAYSGTGTIDVDGTITINGPFHVASDHNVFTGSGTVTFGAGSVIEISPEWWGADPSGTADSAAAINAAVASEATSHIPVQLGPGQFKVTESIVLNNRSVLRGAASTTKYNAVDKLTVLVADATFTASGSVIDATLKSNVGVYDIGIDMDAVSTAAGIELGARTGTTMYSNNTIKGCTLHGGLYGIRARYAAVNKISDNEISGQTGVGILLGENCGDSEVVGNYINTINPDYTGSDLYTGTGIVIGENSSNTNIRGGKIEWNAKGILIYGANGVTVTGINFDVNRWGHVRIEPTNATTKACNGFSLTGNRFLAGGTATGKGAAAVYIYVTDSKSALGTISGNTFRMGGDDAYDLNTGSNIGPTGYGVLLSTSGTVTAQVAVSGNDMYSCSAINTLGVSGAGSIISSGNITNLPNYAGGGGKIFTGSADKRSTNRGDNDVTVQTGIDENIQMFETELTTNRTVTLSTSTSYSGAKFRVVRAAAATGASTLSVGGLKNLAAGQWADVVFDGSAWVLTAFGSL